MFEENVNYVNFTFKNSKYPKSALILLSIIPSDLGTYSLQFELLMCLQTNIHEKLYQKRELFEFPEDKNFPLQDTTLVNFIEIFKY